MKNLSIFLLILVLPFSLKTEEEKDVYKYLNLFGEAFEKIKNNSFTERKHNSSMNIMYKYEFDRKILEQIDVCENRLLFLKKELLRSKNKLGQIISQKKLIEEKLKFSFLEELRVKEEKLLRATPTFRKV